MVKNHIEQQIKEFMLLLCEIWSLGQEQPFMYLTNVQKFEPYSNQKANLNSGHATRADKTNHPHDGALSTSNLSTILSYLKLPAMLCI